MFSSDRQRKAAFYRMNKFSTGVSGDIGFGYGDSDLDSGEFSSRCCMQPMGRMSRDGLQVKVGDRIVGIGDEDHYEFYPGVVKEVSDDKALVVFDESKNEVWYPAERLLSQEMINRRTFRGVRSS